MMSKVESEETTMSHAGSEVVVQTTDLVHSDGTVDLVDVKAIGGDATEMPDGYFRSFEFIGTVAAQCLASICAALGWVLPANTLMLINQDIGPSPNIAWVGTIWTMGISIGFLLVGRFSDLYGRKWIIMGATGLGLIGCIIAATATSVTQLIVANGFNGLGASGQLNFGIVLGELVPNKYRITIITVGYISSLPFGTFGPVIARGFIENTAAGWRWTYYIGIILSVITLVLYQLAYHPPTFSQLHVGKTKRAQLGEIDFVGTFLYISGMVLLLIGISWAGPVYSWTSAHVLAPLIIGLALLAGFLTYEAWICTVQPLVPARMFRNIGFDAVIIVSSVGAMIYYSLSILWPQMLQYVCSQDIQQIGWQSCLLGGGVLIGQIFANFGMVYVPKVKIQMIVVSVLVASFTTALVALNQSNWGLTIAAGFILSFGIGYIENIAVTGVTLLWEPQDIGLASGILGSIRYLAGAIAQALYSSILSSKLQIFMQSNVAQAAAKAGLSPSAIPALLGSLAAGDLSTVPGITPQIEAAALKGETAAYTSAFHYVFYATIPFSVILIVGSVIFPNFEKYLTTEVARKLQLTRREPKTGLTKERSAEKELSMDKV